MVAVKASLYERQFAQPGIVSAALLPRIYRVLFFESQDYREGRLGELWESGRQTPRQVATQ